MKRSILILGVLFLLRGLTLCASPLPPPDEGYNARVPPEHFESYVQSVHRRRTFKSLLEQVADAFYKRQAERRL